MIPESDIKPFDRKKFSGEIPLFPLTNTILLPGQEMGLNVFEMRYRAMVQSVLSGEQLIGLALLKPGWEPHYFETPEIHPVICISWIRSVQRLDDGRFNLVLTGQERAHVDKVIKTIPYRIAKVSILNEKPVPEENAEAHRKWIIQWIDKRLPRSSSLQTLFRKRWSHAPLGRLVDAVAASLQVDPETKYTFLKEIDVTRRVGKLKPLLKGMQLTSNVWKKSKK